MRSHSANCSSALPGDRQACEAIDTCPSAVTCREASVEGDWPGVEDLLPF